MFYECIRIENMYKSQTLEEDNLKYILITRKSFKLITRRMYHTPYLSLRSNITLSKLEIRCKQNTVTLTIELAKQ